MFHPQNSVRFSFVITITSDRIYLITSDRIYLHRAVHDNTPRSVIRYPINNASKGRKYAREKKSDAIKDFQLPKKRETTCSSRIEVGRRANTGRSENNENKKQKKQKLEENKRQKTALEQKQNT